MSSDLKDPREVLLSKLDATNSRIEFTDTPVVLLCGGKVKTKERVDDPEPPVASLRHAITKAFPDGYELFRPEEITDWHSDGMFKDLMSFEVELANICSLVVIILESVGSYSELGAFSQLVELRKKIVVIRSGKFSTDSSFINLGILRHIATNHESGVKSYPWEITKPQEISQEVVCDIVADIRDELSKLQKSTLMRVDQGVHAVATICTLVSLFTALKEHEILNFLTKIGFSVAGDELKRKLFLLERFRIIERRVYSDATFYFRSDEKYHYLRLVLKDGEHADQVRIRAECLEYYNADSRFRNHVRAINARRGAKT